jgi:transcriptional regulator GlxA family with amidase domain
VNPDGLLANPMIACRLQEAIVTGLLLAVDHRYREALTRPDSPGRPVLIKPAIDAVEAHPEQPFTATALAKIAGVSVRTLQQAFRHHLDMPPMTYLRQVRLARAHDDLRTGDHAHMTVAQIARKWGFAHAGRFAAAYCARYGIHPSKTLRRRL